MFSTDHVAAWRYKTVNMVAVAGISALINTLDGLDFPFAFGGDGAGFAVPTSAQPIADEALAAVRRWAQDEFNSSIRAAMMPVTDLRAAGVDVTVARHRASDSADYAMFSGGELVLCGALMKESKRGIPMASEGTMPDLSGLSCRRSHMPAQNGEILSLPFAGHLPLPDALGALIGKLVSVTSRLTVAVVIRHRKRGLAQAGRRRARRLRRRRRKGRAAWAPPAERCSSKASWPGS